MAYFLPWLWLCNFTADGHEQRCAKTPLDIVTLLVKSEKVRQYVIREKAKARG